MTKRDHIDNLIMIQQQLDSIKHLNNAAHEMRLIKWMERLEMVIVEMEHKEWEEANAKDFVRFKAT